MIRRPPEFPDSALARLFFDGGLEPEWFGLSGGSPLFLPGEAAERLYLLRAGRLGAYRIDEDDGERELLGVIRPGEPVGEMSMLAGTPHTLTVEALRDSEVLALPRAAVLAAAERDPLLMGELARLVVRRARMPASDGGLSRPQVFGLVGVSREVSVRALAEDVAAALARMGVHAEVVGAEAAEAPTAWFSAVEARSHCVLYVAEAGETRWRTLCSRQVDRIVRVGRLEADPAPSPTSGSTGDLLLVRAPGVRISGAAAWLADGPGGRVLHARRGHVGDAERLARVLAGRAVALVLSGGGARAYAQVGAVRALREAGVPIDLVGGSSMGSIIAASVAMELSDAEIEAAVRRAFVDSSPLDDIAIPLLAMTQGRKVKQRLAEHFGDVRIEDLPLPFFCLSANLTSGRLKLHRRGLVRDALLASAALPGVMPPVVSEGQVLVDGAVMRNFPADVMRTFHDGPIVGVDVTRSRGLNAADMRRPDSFWRWIVSGEWRRGPPIVALLMSAAVAPSYREHTLTLEAADLLILPDVGGVNIRDWRAYDEAAEAGYRATREALARLERPVTELHLTRDDDWPPRTMGVTEA